MVYLVNLSKRAERDLAHLFGKINAADSAAARKWYFGLKMAILDLEAFPFRCPVTPESDRFQHMLYGTKPHIYRVIYAVDEKKKRVDVLHVRHGARQALKRSELR